MSIKQSTIAMAAAAFFATAGSAAVSAQENCGFMYQRVMEAYQTQSPYYGQMLNHYNTRCLYGASSQPSWEGRHHGYRYDQDRRGYDNDRSGYGGGRWRSDG
jgi:hypothetical protein